MLIRFAGWFLLLLLVFFVLWLGFAGRYLASPQQQAEVADVIVILGGGTGERLSKGAELHREQFARQVLVTGYRMEDELLTQWQGGWRSAYLRENGVAASDIIVNTKVTSTYDESLLVRDLMLQNGWKKALIVSDPPHLRRINWIFSKALAGTGLTFRTIPADAPWWHNYRWWQNSGGFGFVISETIKMLFYIFEYREIATATRVVNSKM